MAEAELARDVHAVLESVRQGVEVVIEQGDRPSPCSEPPNPAGERSRT
jgi:hypothetical protein